MPGFEPRGWEALIDQMEVESQEKPVSKGRQGKKKKKGKTRYLVSDLFTFTYQ